MLRYIFQWWVCILGCTSLSIHGSIHSLCSPVSLCNICCPDLETYDKLTTRKLWQESFTLEVCVRTSPYNRNSCNGFAMWCSVMLNCFAEQTGSRDRHEWILYPMHYMWDPVKGILSEWKFNWRTTWTAFDWCEGFPRCATCVCGGYVHSANNWW